MPFVLEIFKDKQGTNKAVVVDDALYCGICKPKDSPVILKDIE